MKEKNNSNCSLKREERKNSRMLSDGGKRMNSKETLTVQREEPFPGSGWELGSQNQRRAVCKEEKTVKKVKTS